MRPSNLFNKFYRTWRFGLDPVSPAAFGFAFGCIAAATAVRVIAELIGPHLFTYATYYPAILAATLVGGVRAGGLALVLGVIIEQWAFEPPYLAFGLLSPVQEIYLVLYLGASVAIICAADKYRRVIRHLDEEEHYRRLVVDELGHRMKNNLATIQAILRYELRGNQEIWAKIVGRLRALSATNDLVIKSDGQGACIIDILKTEFTPYDVSRVCMQGEPVPLPSKLAVTLALIFHELATNSAKYGALSTQRGRLAVSWVTNGRDIAIDWRESGGPPAVAPTQSGFGKRLFERGLDPFHGRVETQFCAAGFVCTITLVVPNDRMGRSYAGGAKPSLPGTDPAWNDVLHRRGNCT